MKKLGILTLPLETNYGGILQAFALQKILRDMGYDAITIDRHNKRQYPNLKIHLLGFCKRLFQYYVQHKPVSNKWNPFITDEEYRIISQNTQDFINRNIKLTKRVYSEQLDEIEKEYHFDVYVVGSDQVWLEGYCPNSFFDFVTRKGVLKVAYAASCGAKSFFHNQGKLKQCVNLAKSFSGISVREEALVSKCKNDLGVDAQWVLDPTMLLSSVNYMEVVKSSVDKTPIVFSYILDNNDKKKEVVNKIATKLKLPVVDGNIDTSVAESQIYSSVDDWLANINRSEFVITDSFHGTVFAILFNKPFLTVANPTRGIGRFQSLLKLFGLEERMLFEDSLDDYEVIVNEAVDYSRVNKVLDRSRQKSIKFLIDSLNHV